MTIVSRTGDLEALLAVVDCKGFSAAANQLNVQVAKVSRAVSRLEQQLGCTLLNRTTRRVELTEEGHRFVEAVRAGLNTLAEAEEGIRLSQQVPTGRLRVDAASPFVLHQLVPHIRAFRDAFPSVELELTSSDSFIDLLEKRTDVAIRIGELDDSSLHARVLGQTRSHLVASPEYLAAHGMPTSVDDFHGHRCLGFIPPSGLNVWPLGGGVQIEPDIAVSSGEALRQLCLAGNGIANISHFMVADDIAHGRLVSLKPEQLGGFDEYRTVQAVYYRNTALSARIRCFLDFIEPRLTL